MTTPPAPQHRTPARTCAATIRAAAIASLVAGAALLGNPSATAASEAPATESVTAQEAPVITWALSPASETARDGRSWIEADVEPGEVLTEHLSLHNLSDVAATFTLTSADGYFTPTGRFSMLAADTPSTGSGTWITVTEEVTLEAGEQQILPFTVTVPDNATPGDHAAGIAASIRTEGTSADGTSVGVESRVGFRVMTRVAGELAPAIDLADLTATYDTAWNPFEPGEITVGWTAVNTGNTRLATTEDVTAAALGLGTGERTAPESSTELLPGDERELTALLQRAWPLGPITVTITADATTLPESATTVAPTTRTITVWAVPWPQLAVLLGLALVVGSLVRGRRRQRAHVESLVAAAREEGMRAATPAPADPAPSTTGTTTENESDQHDHDHRPLATTRRDRRNR